MQKGSRFAIMDVQDPTNPQLVGETEPLTKSIEMIRVSGNYAFLPQPYGIRIFDVTDKTNPTYVDTYNIPSEIIDTMVISGAVALIGEERTPLDLASEPGGLRILDIADPTNITELAHYGDNYNISDIVVNGNYAYVNGMESDINCTDCLTAKKIILNIANPASPTEVSNVNGSFGNTFIIHNDYLYQSSNSSIAIYDLTNPESPSYINGLNFTIW